MYGAAVFRVKAIEEGMMGRASDPKRTKKFHRLLQDALSHMEDTFLANHQYLCGDNISIADILGVCELVQPLSVGIHITEERPRLAAWMARVKSRLQPHFDEVHRDLYQFGQTFMGDSKL